MWGVDGNNVGISSVLILNTTNPDAITMSTTYIDPNAKIANAGNSGADNSGLSSGAKAGIAVGCVAVVSFKLKNYKNFKHLP